MFVLWKENIVNHAKKYCTRRKWEEFQLNTWKHVPMVKSTTIFPKTQQVQMSAQNRTKSFSLVPYYGAPSYNQRMWNIKYLCGGPFVKVMKTNRTHIPQFKRFMVDNAQVNWNIVWIVFTHLEIYPNHCPIKNELTFSIWFNLWKSTPIDLFGCLIWG